MILTTPEVKHLVLDYDIVFSSGMVLPLTIDEKAGDVITIGDKYIEVFMSAKPSMNDPKKTIPAESMTLFLQHVVSIQHRQREVVELSPEQKLEWARTVQQGMSGNQTIQ